MRALIACILLAACATGSELNPAQRLAGCWINRAAGAVRMRWSENPNSEGLFLGSKTSFGIAGANSTERYALENADGGWRLCRLALVTRGHCKRLSSSIDLKCGSRDRRLEGPKLVW
jgi:hypothetical protein